MATIYGKGGGTTAWGTSLADTIFVYGAAGGYGQGGDDRLIGDGAANKLVGGIGDDYADGGGGADYLDGQDGADRLFGGTGNDVVHGGAGNDHVAGCAGIDRVSGGAGNDRIDLHQGPVDLRAAGTVREYINGGDGSDTLNVNASDASVDGAVAANVFLHWGQDRLLVDYSAWTGDGAVAEAVGVESVSLYSDGPALAYSGSGNRAYEGRPVSVTGTNGADGFAGGLHDETAALGNGNDEAYVSGGRDTLSLGAGRDTLYLNGNFTTDDDAVRVAVNTVVRDFVPGEDAIDASLWGRGPLTVEDRADGIHILGEDASVTLLGVHGYDPFIA
jgi:Ca2+-binding RTX toxin-like protein